MTDVNRLPVLVSLQHVSFQFDNGETLLDNLTFSIDYTPTGIVGRNGRGKTILAQLIAGLLSPSSGSLTRTGNVAYVAQRIEIMRGEPSPISQGQPRPWPRLNEWPTAPHRRTTLN